MDRNRRLYPVVRWGLLPALAHIGLLGLMIAGLVLLKPVSWTPRLNWVPVRMELGRAVNEPTLLRLIHMLLTIPLTAALLALGRRARTDRGAFWAGVLAGITAWQGVGECAWHFGVPVGPDFLFFPKLEGVQGTPVLILFLPVALRIALDDRIGFAFRSWLLAFSCNWLGHWLLLGVGGLLSAAGWMEPECWMPLCGALLGGGGSLLLMLAMFRCAGDRRRLLLLSIALYMALGVLVEGCMGLASGLE